MAPCASTATPAAARFRPPVFGARPVAISSRSARNAQIGGRQHEFAVSIGDLLGLRVLRYRDALGAKGRRERLADGRVLAREKRAARQDRHLTAEPGERLGQFERHRRRADHHQPRGDALAGQRLVRGPVSCVREAPERRDRRAGPGGDQTAVETDLAHLTVGADQAQCACVLEARLAAHERDLGDAGEDALVLGVAQFVDATLLLGQQPLAQDGRCRRSDPGVERARAAQMGDVSGADQDLRRHTADVDAGAADGVAFDQRSRARRARPPSAPPPSPRRRCR